MSRGQKGFTVVEVILVFLILGLVALVGLLLLDRHQSHASKPAPQQWITYSSTASPITFAYPPSWHLHKQSSSSPLEDVTLTGPRGFSMEFTAGTRPTGPSIAACVAPPQEMDVPINHDFQGVISFYKNGNSAETISLRGIGSSSLVSHNCRTYNAIASENIVFTFEGWYSSGSANYNLKNATTFSNLPEVRVARSVFATLRTGSSNTTSSSSSNAQCGCQEFGTCADQTACEGQSTSSKP